MLDVLHLLQMQIEFFYKGQIHFMHTLLIKNYLTEIFNRGIGTELSFTEGIFYKDSSQIYSASPGQKSRQKSKPCSHPAFHALCKGGMDYIIKASAAGTTEDLAEVKDNMCPFVI